MSDSLPIVADTLILQTLDCPCGKRATIPYCPRCQCLIELALAIDAWCLAQEATMSRGRMNDLQRIGGLRGLGYAILGWLLEGLAVAYYICWVLPRSAWLNFTGRRPRR